MPWMGSKKFAIENWKESPREILWNKIYRGKAPFFFLIMLFKCCLCGP
jgi:hypothetical protein